MQKGMRDFVLYERMSCMVVGSYVTVVRFEPKEPSLVH